MAYTSTGKASSEGIAVSASPAGGRWALKRADDGGAQPVEDADEATYYEEVGAWKAKAKRSDTSEAGGTAVYKRTEARVDGADADEAAAYEEVGAWRV